MNETWKPIQGYEGNYEVSNYGRVRSLNYHLAGLPRIIKPTMTVNGYLYVSLSKDGKRKTFAVHRLVAMAFVANPRGLPEINHRDEDKTDNCAWNLEWLCHRDNCNFGTRNARMAKALAKPVLQLDLDGNLVRRWPSLEEVRRQIGFDPGRISLCCNGKRKSHRAFRWRFA